MESYEKHLDNIVKTIKKIVKIDKVYYEIKDYYIVKGKYYVYFKLNDFVVVFDLNFYGDLIIKEKEMIRRILDSYINYCLENY